MDRPNRVLEEGRPVGNRGYTLGVPKRTNTFQAVVFAVKQHLAGDATVTQSEELIDFISGDKREVDICIKAQVAGHPVVISLECRDHQRPQPVGWVEEMHSKHSRLPTDRLVLISRSGFTSTALAKAKSFGIETAVPEDLTETRVGEIVNGARARLTKLDLQLERVRIWVIDPNSEEEEEVVDTTPDNTVFSERRVPIGSMMEVMEIAKSHIMPEFGKLVFNAADDTNRFQVEIT